MRRQSMEKLAGRFEISVPTGGVPDDSGQRDAFIRIYDEGSGVIAIELKTTLIALAEAVFCNRGYVECSFEWNGGGAVGCTREVKHELIDFDCYGSKKQSRKSVLAPYEVDGWIGSESDLTNGHNRVGEKQKVCFIRFIRPDGTPLPFERDQ